MELFLTFNHSGNGINFLHSTILVKELFLTFDPLVKGLINDRQGIEKIKISSEFPPLTVEVSCV